jgi:hypothetical protein
MLVIYPTKDFMGILDCTGLIIKKMSASTAATIAKRILPLFDRVLVQVPY